MKKQDKVPNPGSQEAQDLGCQCPVMDNHRGKGYYYDGNVFIINGNCTIHASKTNEGKKSK